MTKLVSPHPEIPDGSSYFKSHSKFGSEVGYVHYFKESTGPQDTYYLGLKLEEKHAGAPGRGHGGVTMAMLDEVMGRAASRSMNMMCYTASMTTNFCAGSRVGEFLLAKANVSRRGKNLAFVDARLYSGEKLIATATGTWASSGMPMPEGKARG